MADAGGLIHFSPAAPAAPPLELSFREKVHRQLRLVPVNALHMWKISSAPFKILLLITSAVSVLLLFSEMKVRDLTRLNLRSDYAGSARGGGLTSGRRMASCTKLNPCNIQMVADMDTRSLVPGDKPKFISQLLYGTFHFDDRQHPQFDWGNMRQSLVVAGKLSEEGRGMELSELVLWRNQLLSFDDRTGIVYELVVSHGSDHIDMPTYLSSHKTLNRTQEIETVPRFILSEEQDSGKGMKIEWACEKDRALYVGSFGKEYTTKDGSKITGESNFWVVRISENGYDLDRVNWKSQYLKLREVSGTSYPGYLIHEAVNWSDIRRKWYFLPRRESREHYDEKKDEQRGTNLIIEIDEHFEKYQLRRVNFPDPVQPARGFSSFKFIPGTEDQLIIAIRSEEDDEAGILKTHLSIINVDNGKLLMPEFEVSNQFKFEGIEIW